MTFVCALAAVALGALVALWPRLRAWRRGRRVRRDLGEPAERLTEGDVGKTAVLVGVLRAASASRDEGADGRPIVATTLPRLVERAGRFVASAQTHQRADLALACGDDLVSVQGLQVVVGSREWSASSRGADEAAAIVAALCVDPPEVADRAVRVLCEGDRVVARGTVRAVPADAPGHHHYREADAARALVPSPGGFVEVAYAGAPAGPRGPWRLRAPVATTLAAWLALMGAAQIAPRVVNAVHRAMHPCPHDLDVALAHGEPEAASRRAEECGDWVGAARGAWQAADFNRASAAFLQAQAAGVAVGPSLSEVAAHLLAGRYLDSALAARALAQADPADRAILECYADALDVRRGDPRAPGTLSTRALDGGAPAMCTLLAADALLWGDRKPFLRQTAHRFVGEYGAIAPEPDHMDVYAFALLSDEAEDPTGRDRARPRPPEWYPLHGLRGLRYYLLVRPLGLEETMRRAISPDFEAENALTFAAFASYLGDHAEAAKEYQRALAVENLLAAVHDQSPSGLFDYWPPAQSSPYAAGFEAKSRAHRRLFFLGATLALRAREVRQARILASMAPEETHGRAMLAPFFAALSPESDAPDAERERAFSAIAGAETWEPSRQLWSLAASGHTADIPRELRARGLDGRGVIPYVVPAAGAEDAFRSFVGDSYPPPCWTCGPHALLDWVAGRREAAQALGMNELDATLGEAAQRLHAAFVRRDVSVPLYALGRIANP
jgi:hypothetical protein